MKVMLKWGSGVVLSLVLLICGILFLSTRGTDGPGFTVSRERVVQRQIQQQLTIYSAQHHGMFPNRLEDVYKPEDVPSDTWGNPHLYMLIPKEYGVFGYVIISLGADGQIGGDDYASDIIQWSKEPEEPRIEPPAAQ